MDIPKNIAGLLMAAILSDTLMFRSPTCTAVDKAAAERLSAICGVEIEEFSIDMFSAGSDMSSKTPGEIFNQDRKKFQVNEHEFIVAQINSMNSIELDEIKEKLIPYLNEEFGIWRGDVLCDADQHREREDRAVMLRRACEGSGEKRVPASGGCGGYQAERAGVQEKAADPQYCDSAAAVGKLELLY